MLSVISKILHRTVSVCLKVFSCFLIIYRSITVIIVQGWFLSVAFQWQVPNTAPIPT